MAHFPLLFSPLADFPLLPFVSPLCSLLLTWHPRVVTGIVHLPLRLLVNWPCLPTLPPTDPPSPNSQNPTCPAPNNDNLGNIPALAIRNNYPSSCKISSSMLRIYLFLTADYPNLQLRTKGGICGGCLVCEIRMSDAYEAHIRLWIFQFRAGNLPSDRYQDLMPICLEIFACYTRIFNY
jgi:hypothetical protein